MDQWAAHFQEKSERRRRRNSRSRLLRALWIAIVLTALIGLTFWGTLTLMEQIATL